MAHTILNDKRYINLLHNGGFDIWQRGTVLGGTDTLATTTSSSTAVSGLTNVITTLRTGMTVTGASIGSAKTISSFTSNTAIVLSSSSGVTTASGTATVQFGVPTQTYGADRWYLLSQTTGVALARDTGDNAEYSLKATNNAYQTNQRFGFAQILENKDTVDSRGSTVTFMGRFKTSGSQPIMAAIVEWSGTADSLSTVNLVNSWTSTNYTNSGTTPFFSSTTTTVTAVSPAFTPTANATWTDFFVQGTVSSTANNLVVFVWTVNPMSVGSTLNLTQCGLYDSPVALDWVPRAHVDEWERCLRFFQRFDLVANAALSNGFAASSTSAKSVIAYTKKIATPAGSFFGLVADLKVTDAGGSQAATAVTVTLPSTNAALITVTVASGLTSTEGLILVDSGNATHPAIEISADL